jgi:hypothetical protein
MFVRGRLASRLNLTLAVAALVANSALARADEPADATVSSDPVFRLQKLDGTTSVGRIARLSADGTLVLDGDEPVTMPMEQVVSLRREGEGPPLPPEGSVVLFPDGDRLRAIVGAGGEAALEVLPAALGDVPTDVPLDTMLGVVLTPPHDRQTQEDLLRQVREDPRDAEVLWLANGDRLAGSLLSLGTDKVEFQPDTGPLTLGRATVVALGFDPATVRYPRPQGTYLELSFLDGSRLGVDGAAVERGQLTARTRFGVDVRAPLANLAGIAVRGDGIAYLSERPAAGAQYVGYLGGHPELYGRDRTWDGHPIRLSGEAYERGLGTLPRTLLAYRLGPEDHRFQATVGLDDGAGELGSVVFRVLVDGEERFASPPLTHGSPPLPVNVDVRGGKVLILATEFGDRGDVQDSAVWGDARLVR